MVKLLYSLNGRHYEERVQWKEARFRNKQLFLAGAAVYWTEFC